jgi:DNA-binding Lrp family transcriptional regulator
VTARGGRPRTFPPGAVELALVERDRTGRKWAEIARDLKVSPGTLRARVSEFRRSSGAHKTPAPILDAAAASARSSEVEIVLEVEPRPGHVRTELKEAE